MPRRGLAGAVASTPSACSRSITSFQPEASAKAPCTRTTVGRDPSCGFSLMVSSLSGEPPPRLRGGLGCIEGRRQATVSSFWSAALRIALRIHGVAPPFCLGISPLEEGREGLGLVYHVGGEHPRGDGPDVPCVVDDAYGDHERVAGMERQSRPVVELHRHVAPHDVPYFRTRVVVPTGGDALGDLDEGLGYLPA